MTRHVLVTGGAGFVGSAYVRALLTEFERPARITVLDKLTYAAGTATLAPVLADPRVRFVRGDVCDAALVDTVMRGQDTVVHFAAESHVDRSIEVALPFVMSNVAGTQVLLDAALRHGIATFLHVSTDEVYGTIERGSWTETAPARPNSPYAATKAGADMLCLAYARTHGMDVRITRSSNNYGPYQHPEKVIPLFVTNLLLGRKVPLYGDGLNVRDWLHVDDNCRGIQLVLEHGRAGEIYNIGGRHELTNLDLTAAILGLLGKGPEAIEWTADRKGHDRRYSLDCTKATAELGYRPRLGFEAGLAATVEWYRANRDWWEPLRGRPAELLTPSPRPATSRR
ncbi:dTDP-glucose 4,6-dehydratase [Actinomadura sp. WMMB 499]|uniref:dTDP-glucose 4,6-dehydratase n=1 Tax=Actinomadura sp. WMMB 499 TaxID=1219491 RepID=UPI001246A608|nr:dTDP-glucose 4,6-dehydratase [Actinomadura sp. WMMB 499]QFG22959.1 dTDP-glucose 4,6-dehydratase [Actinomadura sp. WMMB 499]